MAMHHAWRRCHFPGSPLTLLGLGWGGDYGRAGSELSREECLRAVVLAHHMYHKAEDFAQQAPMSLERAYEIREVAELAMERLVFHVDSES